MINTFYSMYPIYFFSFTPSLNVEIRTFEMFKSRFPFVDTISEAQEVKRGDIKLLQDYLIDKETGLTPEQLETYFGCSFFLMILNSDLSSYHSYDTPRNVICPCRWQAGLALTLNSVCEGGHFSFPA